MTNELDVRWIGQGKLLKVTEENRVQVSDPVKEGMIHIQETDKSFVMPGYEDAAPAGIPIDANLAVYFIQRLHKKLQSHPFSKLLNTEETSKTFSEQDSQTVSKWLVNLLVFSRAISIDKNILLKIISQPKCEGVRFYLGLKDNEAFNPGSEENAKNPKEVLVLILVGINSEGVDLHYTLDPLQRASIKNGKFELVTTSATGEYNYPPPPNNFTKASSEKCYVLGELAWNDFYDNFL